MLVKKILLSILTLTVSLLLFFMLEGIARVTNLESHLRGESFKRGTNYDPFLQWRGNPIKGLEKLQPFRLNSRGFRGPEIEAEKPPGVQRIAVLGDSCTFGIVGVGKEEGTFAWPEPYPRLLQRKLDRSFGLGRFEVINYGTIGYSTFHARRLLYSEVLDDDPDFVVIRFGFNDHLASHTGHSVSDPHNRVLEWLKYMTYKSRLLAILHYMKNRYVAPSNNTLGRGPPSPNPTVWVEPDEYAFNLSRMIDLARGHGAHPILVDEPAAPVTPQIRENKLHLYATGYDTLESLLKVHARYQDITAAVAKEKGVLFVRTDVSYSGMDQAPVFSQYDIIHPNAAGHERIARRLHAEIAHLLARAGVSFPVK